MWATEGMVSRKEYMKFMEAEFDRLDKEKRGELDARKLAQSNLSASRFVESNAQLVAATFKLALTKEWVALRTSRPRGF